MAKLFNWLKDTSARLLDPNRQVILADQTRRIEESLYRDSQSFDLHALCAALGVLPEDVRPIAIGIYRRASERAWADEVVTEKERRALGKIAGLLKISPADARQVELSFGLEVFERCLSTATSDGVLDERDGHRLASVAASLGTTTRDLILTHFADEGEGIVRSMFASIAEDGVIESDEWNRLVRAAASLGLNEVDVRTIVRAQAEPFVEHVLTEAKADGHLTGTERRKIDWLLTNLDLSPNFRAYVTQEVTRLDLFAEIAQGRLPVLPSNDIGLKAGELVHHRCRAIYMLTRQLKSGPRHDRFDGEMLVTDNRLIFTSAEKTIEVNHRRVVDIDPTSHGFDLRASSKGSGSYYTRDPQLAYAILRTAVGRANQTIIGTGDESATRHIPRDVRQRVWQRYGGRCAECGSTQYLEFDHIIPHSRGGSNSDNNVQLLCRGCNGKKSDHI
jgi:uncharacterized membrane protein YebE (DUF533 family)